MLACAESEEEMRRALLVSFFNCDEGLLDLAEGEIESQEERRRRVVAREYWERVKRQNDECGDGGRGVQVPLPFVGREGTSRQMAAGQDWNLRAALGERERGAKAEGGKNGGSEREVSYSYERLHELRMPTLVLNGDEDLLIPTSRSWELLRGIPEAKLVVYPDCGHGFLWERGEAVGAEIGRFLDVVGDGMVRPRL